ncbi:unnamed protein product [Arabis nemorensis]|uniref:Uncharacterized protein n=1 Tax=Arabis nemorensis TaxID=586526 RepID=A0A565BI64_9BRAS|nr:unnamed protein product [Arabis nemorensis]
MITHGNLIIEKYERRSRGLLKKLEDYPSVKKEAKKVPGLEKKLTTQTAAMDDLSKKCGGSKTTSKICRGGAREDKDGKRVSAIFSRSGERSSALFSKARGHSNHREVRWEAQEKEPAIVAKDTATGEELAPLNRLPVIPAALT